MGEKSVVHVKQSTDLLDNLIVRVAVDEEESIWTAVRVIALVKLGRRRVSQDARLREHHVRRLSSTRSRVRVISHRRVIVKLVVSLPLSLAGSGLSGELPRPPDSPLSATPATGRTSEADWLSFGR